MSHDRGNFKVEPRRKSASTVFPDEVTPPPFFLRGTALEDGTHGAVSPGEPETFEEFIVTVMSRRRPGLWCLFIPHWLILLVTVGATGGLLVWRMRRWRKLQEPVVAIEPGEKR